jgi:hypothetical protein
VETEILLDSVCVECPLSMFGIPPVMIRETENHREDVYSSTDSPCPSIEVRDGTRSKNNLETIAYVTYETVIAEK